MRNLALAPTILLSAAALFLGSCQQTRAASSPPETWRATEPCLVGAATVEGIRDQTLAQNTAAHRAKAEVSTHMETLMRGMMQTYRLQLADRERQDFAADLHLSTVVEGLREAVEIGAQSWTGEQALATAVLTLASMRSVLNDMSHRHEMLGLDQEPMNWLLDALQEHFDALLRGRAGSSA